MTDKKISDLPPSTVLDGTELVEIQKGVGPGSSQSIPLAGIYRTGDLAFVFKANIGDGAAATFTLTHGLNTRDVQVEIYRNAAPWDTGLVDVARPDVNNVNIGPFSTAPGVNGFRVLIRAN